MANRRNIESPEMLWDLFVEYKKSTVDITATSFLAHLAKTRGHCNDYLKSNKKHPTFRDVAEKIKKEIFDYNLQRYINGEINHSVINFSIKKNGISHKPNAGANNYYQTRQRPNEFVMNKGVLTLSDKCLGPRINKVTKHLYKNPPDTVYLLNISGSNIYKLGVTQNAKRRIFVIRSAMPFNVDIVDIFTSDNVWDIEDSFYNEYQHCHIKNEWYRIEDIDLVLKKLKSKKI
jgi:hypothetical protein